MTETMHTILQLKFSSRLAQDMRTSNYKKLLERKKLEESWDVSVHQKQQHLLSEKQHSKDTGLLLHDQCVKYKR